MGLFLGFLSCSLVYISVFVSVPYCLDDCSFDYNLRSGRLITSPPFFLKTALAIQGVLYFHKNCKIICSGSVKNAISSLIRIALNLQIAFGSIVIFIILILPILEHCICDV